MAKMLWVALGAAGGVLAYRKGQQLMAEAKEKGVVGSVQAVTGSTAGLAAQARQLLAPRPAAEERPGSAASGPSGAAAARALAQARNADVRPSVTPPGSSS